MNEETKCYKVITKIVEILAILVLSFCGSFFGLKAYHAYPSSIDACVIFVQISYFNFVVVFSLIYTLISEASQNPRKSTKLVV